VIEHLAPQGAGSPRGLSEPAPTRTIPPPAPPPSDLAPLVAAAAEHGTEILGPPGIPA
jgi:hypothetical protein